MKKEHKPSLENPEENHIEEAAFAYSSTRIAPCQYSIKELQKRIKESVRQIEEGNYYTHAQMKELYKTWK